VTAMGTAETFWIDIEDSAGNKVGPGPITTAEGWQWSPRLDEAGTFRFRMPASDPAAAYLVEKRVVRCYAVIDGAVTALGAGVIDEVALDVGDPSTLEVSGPDLLAELSQVSVKQLRICEQGWTLLTDGRGAVHRIRTYWEDGQWKHEDAPRYKMFDGDFGTHDNILMYRYTYPHIGYLYVGHDARFDKARFTIIDRPNNVATTLHAQYFNGVDWVDLPINDGTRVGDVTMAQSGTVEWTRPTDWVRNTPTSTAGDWFWVRFTVGEGTSTLDSFRIEEVEVYADIPTTNGVNLIMQYAPAGWATSGYPQTAAPHYIEFDGESILTALGALIEQGGQDGAGNPIREHFRLGSGRTLTWLGTTLTDTGLRAVDADGIRAEGARELCLIQHLSRRRDASNLVTRLYPFTADGIDLALTTRTAPPGYTLVKGAPVPGQPWATASYLQRASTLGVIEGWARFQDVGMQQGDSYLVHPEMASNALFDRALEYLRTHGAPQEFYDLTVAQVPKIILPGSTIDVVYHEYVDGYHAVDIDTVADGEPLVILATTLEVDNSGAVTTALEVATIDRHAASDASVIAGSIRELRRIQGTTGGLSSHTTIHREVSGTAAITGGVITGVTIDNSPIGQLAPSTGAFTALSAASLSVSGDIAVTGTVDGVDISAHAANDSAHHAPVTVGNTGLSIAGQQVSLRLAAVSGLEISSGLRLADSIAGAGLTIASKVLAVGAGDGISVGADTVAVRLASPAGLSFSGGALQLDDTVAGAGLAINAKVLGIDLATNSGLQLSGSPAKLRLRTPSSLDATTANTVTDVLGHTHKVTTGSARGLSASTVNAEGTGAALARADHGHAITAYSDLATYPGQLAKADASGDSRWHRIDLTDRLRAPLIDTATGQGLTIAPDEDLSLSPVSGVVKATSGVAIGSDHYVSQMTGWRAGYDGGADFRYLYADELHAKSFITDLEQALAGGQIISKSVAVIAVDFTVPAAGAAGTLTVEDLPGANGQAVFQDGDMVRLRQFTRGSGSLSIANCWGVVTGYTDNADGTQSWTFTRSSGARAGTATAGSTIPARSLALDYGTSGNGFYEVNAIDGVWAQNSPYAQVVTWATHPADGQVVRSRWGNLRGIFAQADDFGLYAAVAGHTDADQYLRISSLGAVLHNLPLELYASGDKVLALDPTGPSLALGNPIPTGWLSQSGFWAGNDGGTYKHYVGQVSGGALVKGASWDGQSYNVVGNLIVGPGVGYVVDNALLHLPFDGPLPYEQDFHVDLSGHLGQKPTVASGGIIGRPGKFGKAVQLAEATTNYVKNPSFEVNVTDYWQIISSDGSATRTRDTSKSVFGSASCKLNAGTSTWRAICSDNQGTTLALPNGATCTVSGYLFRSAPGGAQLRIYTGATVRGSFSATQVGEWEYISGSWTNDTGGTANVHVRVDWSASAGDVWCDAIQLEAKSYPTPYCDGSLGPGHAWTGTPHASTSTRAAAHLVYPKAISEEEGTIAFWAYRDSWALPTLDTFPRLYQSGPGTTPQWAAYLRSDTAQMTIVAGGESEAQLTFTPILPPAGWVHFTHTWGDFGQRLYIGGELAASHILGTASADVLAIGGRPSAADRPLNGYLDDLLILDRALTADEVRQLYTSGRPVTVTGSPHSLLLTGPGRGKVEGHAGGIFGWDGAAQPMWGFCNEDGVSFGGATLNAGDVMIGDPAGGNYLQWDASAGTLTVRGTIVVQPGSSGLANMSDANLDNVADGATYKRTTANEKAGGARGYAGLDTSGNVARVIRGAAIAAGSAATGLNLTADYLGYYDGTAFRTYLDKNGNFLFSRPGGASLLWSAATGKLQGRDSSNNVQWETDATTGAIVAGGGSTVIDSDGITLDALEHAGGTPVLDPGSVIKWFSSTSSSEGVIYCSQDIVLGQSELVLRAPIQNIYSPVSKITLGGILDSYIVLSADAVYVSDGGSIWVRGGGGLNLGTATGAGAGSISASGSLNLGTATGAAAGSISASGGVNLGTATGAGAGNIVMANSGAGNTLLSIRDVNAAFAERANIGHWDGDGGLFNLWDDAGNNTVKIRGYASGGVQGWFNAGRILIGTTSDDGVNMLQVNGSIKATGGLNLGTATGAGAGNLHGGTSNSDFDIVGIRDLSGSDTAGGIRLRTMDGSTQRTRLFISRDRVALYGGNDGAETMRVVAGHRILIGTTTDDGVNRLQVNGSVKAIYAEMNWLQILDGVAAPATVSGWARIYVDSADGDLKIKFGNGTVKTIVTD
jgi:hypothetical protein